MTGDKRFVIHAEKVIDGDERYCQCMDPEGLELCRHSLQFFCKKCQRPLKINPHSLTIGWEPASTPKDVFVFGCDNCYFSDKPCPPIPPGKYDVCPAYKPREAPTKEREKYGEAIMMLRKDGIEPAPANKDSDTNQNYAKPLVFKNSEVAK